MLTFENKLKFVRLAESGRYVFKDLCSDFGLSPKTGHKWRNRYREEGEAGLRERSRRPNRISNQTSENVEQLIIKIRKKYCSWGAKKIRVVLMRDYGIEKPPALSTITNILKRNGFIKRGPQRPERYITERVDLGSATEPNQIWCVDHKGSFMLKNGDKCYPLTITDLFSRCIIKIEACITPTHHSAHYAFRKAFSQFGLPETIRVDNGTPFASNGPGGLSRLSVWWMELGISIEFIRPGKPQDNGSHERMHRTMKDECCTPGSKNIKAQQQRINRWVKTFNHVRPHESIGMKVPADLYHPSNNRMIHGDKLYLYGPTEETVMVSCLHTIKIDGSDLKIGKAFQNVELALDRCSETSIITIRYLDLVLGEYRPGENQKIIAPVGYYAQKGD